MSAVLRLTDLCFIKLMSQSYFSFQAAEMLIFGKKLTAAEACAQGLVTEVFPDSTFQKEVWTRLKAYSKLPPNVCVLFFSFLIVETMEIMYLP